MKFFQRTNQVIQISETLGLNSSFINRLMLTLTECALSANQNVEFKTIRKIGSNFLVHRDLLIL